MDQPQRRIAPWYVASASMGLIASGLLPVLLPLLVVQVSHRLDYVGYVTAAYNLGLFSAPPLGALAERTQAYRTLFIGGLAVLGLSAAGLPLVSHLAPWLLLSAAVGVGAAAVTVVGNLLIVDFVPAVEWEPRLGWLQGLNGAGQVAGLLLAAVFTSGQTALGIWVAAATALPALFLGRIGLPVGEPSVKPHASPGLGALPHQAHRLRWADLIRVPEVLRHAFGRFLLSWFAYNLGVAAFFAYFPLLMRRSFGIDPSLTAIAYAVFAALGTVLFVLAGQWAGRFGDRLLYVAALAVRLVGFVLLSLLLLPLPGRTGLALLGFGLIVLAWPLISVAGTGLAARLTPIGEGAAIGLLSAAGALATVLGNIIAGPAVRALGYPVALFAGLLGMVVAIVIARGGVPPRDPAAPMPDLQDTR
jgi:MFS family permease